MVIRCEGCSTLYELDEALLSPAGSQVQCTRCQHVFTAFPARAPGRTLVGMPAQAEPERPASPAERVRVTPRPRVTPRNSAAVGAGGPGPAAAPRAEPPRPVRTGPPPVYRPAAGAPAPVPRAPLLRRDTVGTFESRLRWHARWKWLGPLIAVIAVAGAAAGWFLLSRRGAPDPSVARAGALALLARDDRGSVEQALARLDDVLRRAPRQRGVAADRALAQVLRAAAIAEEGESLAARRGQQEVERARLQRERPAGWQDAERAAAAETQRLELEVRAREERARGLAGEAFQALRRIQGGAAEVPEIARGMAAYHALAGERDQARKIIRAARERAPADPWLDLAEGWADARDPDRAVRERALLELGALASSHPELLRARLLLARTQAGLGRREEALATLDGLVAANAEHEAGRRLRDELASPPAEPAPLPAPDPAAVTPPQAKPTPQRRRVIQPAAEPTPLPLPAAPPRADLPAVPEPQPGTPPGAQPEPPTPHEARAAPPAPPPPGAEARPRPSSPPLPQVPVPEPQLPTDGG